MQGEDGADILPLSMSGCDSRTTLLRRQGDQIVDNKQTFGLILRLSKAGTAGLIVMDCVQPVANSAEQTVSALKQ